MATTETALDVHELAAGRELDALVAERVMGWRWYRFQKHMLDSGSTYGRMLRSSEDEFTREHMELADASDPLYQPNIKYAGLAGPVWCDGVPAYSTDIAAAHQLLVKIREWDSQQRYWFSVRLRYTIEDRLQRSIADNYLVLYAEPIDICRAALKATQENA